MHPVNTYLVEPSEPIVWNGKSLRIKSCQLSGHINEIVLIAVKKQFSGLFNDVCLLTV